MAFITPPPPSLPRTPDPCEIAAIREVASWLGQDACDLAREIGVVVPVPAASPRGTACMVTRPLAPVRLIGSGPRIPG